MRRREPSRLEDPSRRELERRRNDGGPSPFEGLPFGGLLEAMQGPYDLGTFDDVGGMERLKQEIRDSVGLMLEHPDEAARYGIECNGILLHGAPGVGKTFFARRSPGVPAALHPCLDRRPRRRHPGAVGEDIDKAFQTALDNLLLTSLESYRDQPGLLVMAATNNLEHLDPAVIRPGRFGRHIRIDLPDAPARRAILDAELHDRPFADDIDLEELVRRREGMTPAMKKVVDAAALAVFREAAQSGRQLALDEHHLLTALESLGGAGRPMVEHWVWESLVLPETTKAQLRQLQAIIEEPESVQRFGIDPPTGLLLAGPPGTGETTVAKVIAAQARCSFYPVSGADVMSKWVGGTEDNIRRLFEPANENRPSVVTARAVMRSCGCTPRGCRPSASRTDGFSPTDLKALCRRLRSR